MVNEYSRRLWIVRLLTQAPGPDTPLTDGLAVRLADLLARTYGALATPEGSAVDVQFPVAEIDPVHDADEAAHQAQVLVLDAVRQLDLDGWEIGPGIAVEMPEVLGAQEVAGVLGVTRQRLHELRRSGRFPEPILELAAGPIWLGTVVRAFASGDRRPGRRTYPFECAVHGTSEAFDNEVSRDQFGAAHRVALHLPGQVT